MTVENPYQPPTYGMRSLAIERRIAAQEAASADLPALSGMTKDELIAQAEAEGVDLSEASNNDDRRAAIEKARA